MLKFVFKNSVLYTFASQVPMFANLLLYPIISEFLTPFDYYVFGTAMGYIGLMSMVSELGMSPLFQNAFFKNRRFFRVLWSNYLGFLMVYKFFFSLLVGAMLWLVFNGTKVPDDRLWLIIGMVVLPIATTDLARGVGMRLMQFKHRHRVVHVSTAIAGVLTVISSYLTIYVYKLGYLGFFISNFVSMLFQGIFFAILLYGAERILPVVRWRPKRIGGWLKISLPLIPHKFSDYLLSTSDRVVLDQYVGTGSVTTQGVGLYNVAYNFANYFNHFSAQVNTVISPIYFSLFAKDAAASRPLIRAFTYLWLGFNYVVAVIAGLWSKEVFAFFFMNNTTGLKDAYPYVIFLFLAFCYRPLYVASVDFIIYNEKTVSLLKISTAAGILNVVLNVILVPFFGIESAVFATFLSYMYMGVAGHLFPDTRKYIGQRFYVIPIFIAITLSGFFLLYAVDFAILHKAILTLVIIGITLLIFLKKGRSLIHQLREIRPENT